MRSDVTCFGMPEPEDLRSTNQSFPKAMAPDGTGLRLSRALLRAPLVSQRAILTDPIEAEWGLGPLPSCVKQLDRIPTKLRRQLCRQRPSGWKPLPPRTRNQNSHFPQSSISFRGAAISHFAAPKRAQF